LSYFLSSDVELGGGFLRLLFLQARVQPTLDTCTEAFYKQAHCAMPYDAIQGQGQKCFKATQEESTVSPARD